MAKIRKEDTPERKNKREFMRVYRQANIEKIKENENKRYLANKEEENKRSKENYNIEYYRQYREINREKINRQSRARKANNKDIDSINRKERRKTDINYLLITRLRSRIACAIRDKTKKTGSSVRDLGCSIGDFKLHLESLFQEEMSWENYGRTGWHIDHIIPLSSFDLTNREELLKACNYTNLQPLWAKDNLHKGCKIHHK